MLHFKKIKPKEQMPFRFYWSECRDSNSRPLEPHSSAIPNFATPGYAALSLALEYISTPWRKMQALF